MAKAKTLLVTQTSSAIGREKSQGATLKGMGLGKIGRTVELEATPIYLGMIRKVAHLVSVQEK